MQSVFKIEGVLVGDARIVALEGRDAADRRVRIELPADEAGSVAVGSVLVVQWWTAELPGDASSLAATAGSEEAAEVSTSVSDRVEAEFRRLMGLR